jgi:hypothetical protein
MSYKRGPNDQLDWTATARNDRYQVPVDPTNLNPSATGYAFLRDIDQEKDSFMHLIWTQTINSNTLLTVSPFYHWNNSRYIAGASDPLRANSRNTSNYVGSQTELRYAHGLNNVVSGLYGFYQNNNQFFSLASGSAVASVSSIPTGGVGAASGQRPVQTAPLADVQHRNPPDAFLRSHEREFSQSTHWSDDRSSQTAMGGSKFLRNLLSGSSSVHCRRRNVRS